MRSLAEINQAYEEIIHGEVKEPYRSQNRSVIALYRKISMSRDL